MSNKPNLNNRTARNVAVLIGRGLAEVTPGQEHIATVKHDSWCPGLKSHSMLDCVCSPEISIERVR